MRRFLARCSIFLVIRMVLSSLPTEEPLLREMTFTKISYDGTDTAQATYSNCRSPLACAVRCRGAPDCHGYHYDSSAKTCEVYSRRLFPSSNSLTNGKILYAETAQACPTSRGFQELIEGGITYCLGLFQGQKVDFATAQSRCQALSARLFHLDEPSLKMPVLLAMAVNMTDHIWIALDDQDVEGQWVLSWNGELADMLGIHWKNGEPNGSKSNEDCAILAKSGELKDKTCDSDAYYLCEF